MAELTQAPSMPLRDIELKTYKIQGIEYKQRKPSFDYRLKELNIKLGHAWDYHFRGFLKDALTEISEKQESFKTAYEYISKDDIEKIFLIADTPERNELTNKLNEFGKNHPLAFKDFMHSLNLILSDTFTAMQLFIIMPDNKKKLFTLTLEGDIDKINYKPDNIEDDEELDRVAIELLNFFVSKSRISTKSLIHSKLNMTSIN